MKAWFLPLIASAFLCASPQLVQAADGAKPESPPEEQPSDGSAPTEDELPSAESLGIVDTEEAVLLITDTEGLQRVTLGSNGTAPTGSTLVLRQLKEGLLPLLLESEQRSWEGSVRLYAGQVTLVSAANNLNSPESLERAEEEFDLFEFYDRMDQLSSLEEKIAQCDKTQATPPPPPDDSLVSDLCRRFKKQAELEAEMRAEDLEAVEEEFSEGMLDAPEEEAERRLAELKKLYRADGRLRKFSPGTPLRLGVAALGFAGSVAGLGSGLHFELQAEKEYLLYRESERVGDDPAMTRHLFVTQQFDRRRDAAIGIAAASLTAGVVALLIQRAEARRFARYRASIKDGEDTPNE